MPYTGLRGVDLNTIRDDPLRTILAKLKAWAQSVDALLSILVIQTTPGSPTPPQPIPPSTFPLPDCDYIWWATNPTDVLASRLAGFRFCSSAGGWSWDTATAVKMFLSSAGTLGVAQHVRVPDNGYFFSSAALEDAYTARTAGMRFNTSTTPDRLELEPGQTVREYLSVFASGTNASLDFTAAGVHLADSTSRATNPSTQTFRGLEIEGSVSVGAVAGTGGPNLLTDPGFESWTDASNAISWGDRHLGFETREGTIVHSGTYSAAIVFITTTDGAIMQSRPRSGSTTINLSYGTTYTLSFWYYSLPTTAGKDAFWDVWELSTASGNTVNYSLRNVTGGGPGAWAAGETVYDGGIGTAPFVVMPGNSAWNYYTTTFTTRAGVGTFPAVLLFANGGSTVSGDYWYVDDAVLQVPSTAITAPIRVRGFANDQLIFKPTLSGTGDTITIDEISGAYLVPTMKPTLTTSAVATVTEVYGQRLGFAYDSSALGSGTLTILNPYTLYVDPPGFGTNPWAAGFTGNVVITNAKELRFYEPSGSPASGNYSSFKAGAQSVDIGYTLPLTQGAANSLLKNDGSNNLSWITQPLLDGSTHTDTLAGTVVRGDLIVGNSTPKWSRLGIGAPGGGAFYMPLVSNGTDVSWQNWSTLGVQTGAVTQNVLAKGSSIGNQITDSRVTDTGTQISVANATQTGSGAGFGIAHTFNGSATMEGFKFNVTNTASGSASNLFNFSLNNTDTVFKMSKGGMITQITSTAPTAYSLSHGFTGASPNVITFDITPAGNSWTGTAIYHGFRFSLTNAASAGGTNFSNVVAFDANIDTGMNTTEGSVFQAAVGAETSTWTTLRGFHAAFTNNPSASGSGALTATDLIGFHAEDYDTSGGGTWAGVNTITRQYGYRMDASSSGATDIWGFAVEHDGAIKRDKYLFWAAGNTTVVASRDWGVRYNSGGSAFEIDYQGNLRLSLPNTAPSAYTPSNVTTDRSYDANSTTLDELADVLGTLIADLQARKLIG